MNRAEALKLYLLETDVSAMAEVCDSFKIAFLDTDGDHNFTCDADVLDHDEKMKRRYYDIVAFAKAVIEIEDDLRSLEYPMGGRDLSSIACELAISKREDREDSLVDFQNFLKSERKI